MLTLVITRHGLTARSVPEQHLGQKLDIALSEEGRAQAHALAGRLAEVTFGGIVASPLVRAHQTARIVAAGLSGRVPAVETDTRLAEMDYGEWEGLTYAEIDARDAARRRAWEADPAGIRCPGGESGDDVAIRARDFLVDLLASNAAADEGPRPGVSRGSSVDPTLPILAVAHSSFNRILVCVALGLPVREFRLRLQQDQVNLTVLRFEHGTGPSDARLILLNDLAHVRPPGATPWA
ncbi:MAG: histidine phosphatase family protein [Candidatus Limnocylindrales bacterium]